MLYLVRENNIGAPKCKLCLVPFRFVDFFQYGGRAITIEIAIKKRIKVLIPKLKQRRLRAITIQGAITILEKKYYLIAPESFRILGAPILFSPSVFVKGESVVI